MGGLAGRRVSGAFARRLEALVKALGARDPKAIVGRLTYREVLLELQPMNAIGLLRARATLKQANAARDQRDWPGAASMYREALAVAPGMAGVWMQYGHSLKESGDRIGAGEAYSRALKLRPWRADTHLQIGHLNRMNGNLDAAASSYARALEIDPGLADAARELRQLGRTVNAVDVASAQDSHRSHRRGKANPDLEAKIDAIGDQINRFLEHVSTSRALAFEVATLKAAVAELQPAAGEGSPAQSVGHDLIRRVETLETMLADLAADPANGSRPK